MEIKKFEENKTYQLVHKFGCGYDAGEITIEYIVVKRTEKTIWYKLLAGFLTEDLNNKVQKAKIKFCDWAKSEYFDLNFGSCISEFAYIK